MYGSSGRERYSKETSPSRSLAVRLFRRFDLKISSALGRRHDGWDREGGCASARTGGSCNNPYCLVARAAIWDIMGSNGYI